MSAKKYASDYKLEPYKTSDGKVKDRRVYTGTWYRFVNSPLIIKRLRLELFIGCSAIILLLLPLLFANNSLGRTIYIVLPCAAAFVPLYLLMAGALRLTNPEEKFNRENRDKTDLRISGAGLILPVFLAVSCVGCAVHAALSGMEKGETATMFCLAAAWCISMYLMTRRKKAETVSLDPPEVQAN